MAERPIPEFVGGPQRHDADRAGRFQGVLVSIPRALFLLRSIYIYGVDVVNVMSGVRVTAETEAAESICQPMDELDLSLDKVGAS